MKRERYELILGTVVLVAGIIILIAVLAIAFGLAYKAGDFFEEQLPEEETVEGPRASFSWSSDDYNVTFDDTLEEGDSNIVSWDWDFGDGDQSNDQHPNKRYDSYGDFEVHLTVEDENGERSSAHGPVQVVANDTRSGVEEAESRDFDFGGDFGRMLLPLALAILVVGLHFVMVVVGGSITKAGWNLIKPKPETVKVRVKPKDLEVEPIHVAPVQQAPVYQPAPPIQPVQPQEEPPPPPE